MAGDVEVEEGRGGVGGYPEIVGVEGVDDDEVTVGAMTGRRGRADEVAGAGVVGELDGAVRQPAPGGVAGARWAVR